MPRSPKDNELIRSARRQEIFLAAGRVFAKKGFAATKIADIAAEAKLSHGLLYHYFRSKEEVYSALFDELLASRPQFEDELKHVPRALDRLRMRVGFWLEKSVERPEITVLVTQALISDNLPPRTREVFRDFSRDSYARMIADVQEAQRDGDADPHTSAEELATALTSLVRGLATMLFVRASAFGEEHGADVSMLSVETVLRLLRACDDSTTASRSTKTSHKQKKRVPATTPSPRKAAVVPRQPASKRERIQKEKSRGA